MNLIKQLKKLADMLSDIVIPEKVCSEIREAVEAADADPLSTETKKWMKENLPTINKKLYRGTGIYLDDEALSKGSWSDTTSELPEDIVRRTFGVGFEGLCVGCTVRHDRGEESHWTTDKDIAQEFQLRLEGDADPYQIALLLEADVAAKDILLDTTLLSEEILNRLGLDIDSAGEPYQKEVIVENIPVKAKIIDIQVDEMGQEWLEENGYEVHQNHIIKL